MRVSHVMRPRRSICCRGICQKSVFSFQLRTIRLFAGHESKGIIHEFQEMSFVTPLNNSNQLQLVKYLFVLQYIIEYYMHRDIENTYYITKKKATTFQLPMQIYMFFIPCLIPSALRMSSNMNI